jgi:head-tail adaptor
MMRHKIDIQNFTVVASSYGEPVKTWANLVASRWCGIEFAGGAESFGGEGFPERLSGKTAVFTIRYTTYAIDETMRIVHKSKNWNILSIINTDSMNREFKITAELIE